jgi:hypothetical protein
MIMHQAHVTPIGRGGFSGLYKKPLKTKKDSLGGDFDPSNITSQVSPLKSPGYRLVCYI